LKSVPSHVCAAAYGQQVEHAISKVKRNALLERHAADIAALE
tara:strand:+ start:1858 stop:1983 length:126 start_codon:yes stop_codon:yes gene_type:complete